jgi:Flp pilus assembly protein TadD/4-amino-4-deoxy-L-arabinose transferase-like glycosyltransferase
VRLLVLAELSDSALHSIPFGDDEYFHEWAEQIAEGEAPSELFYHAPLYPYFLGTLYRFTDTHRVEIARLVQALLGAASCVLLAVVGGRFFSQRVGLLGGLLLALYPPAILHEGLLKKTALSLFLLVGVLALLARCLDAPRRGSILAMGLVLGCLAISRENTRLLLPVLLLWLWFWFRERSVRERVLCCALLVAGFAVAPVSVGLRNGLVAGEYVFGTTNFGTNLYIGNRAGASGLCEPLIPGRGNPALDPIDARELAEAASGRQLGASEVSRFWRDRALEEVLADPLGWLLLLGRKARLLTHATEWVDHHALEAYQDESLLLRTLGWPLRYGIVLPLGIAGMVLAWPRRRRLAPLYLGLLALAVSLLPFFVFARFRISFLPFLLPFAAFALLRLGQSLRQREHKKSAWILGGTLTLVLAVHLPIGVVEWPRSSTYNSLAISLANAGRVEEAIENAERAVELQPANASAHFNLGMWLLDSGQVERGAEHLTECARLDDGYKPVILHRLGVHRARTGELERAFELLGQSARLDPSNPEVHYDLGLVQRNLGRWAEAEAAYREAIRLRAGHVDAINNLAYLLELQGGAEEAVELYRTAIRLAPDYVQPRINLARLLATNERLLDGAAARLHAERARELAGETDAILEVLADAHAAEGRILEAVKIAGRLRERFLREGRTEQAERLSRRIEDYESRAESADE